MELVIDTSRLTIRWRKKQGIVGTVTMDSILKIKKDIDVLAVTML